MAIFGPVKAEILDFQLLVFIGRGLTGIKGDWASAPPLTRRRPSLDPPIPFISTPLAKKKHVFGSERTSEGFYK